MKNLSRGLVLFLLLIAASAPARAQVAVTHESPAAPSMGVCGTPCAWAGMADIVASQLVSSLRYALSTSAMEVEARISTLVDDMVENALKKIDDIEGAPAPDDPKQNPRGGIAKAWYDLWFYNLLPALQTMTDKVAAANAEYTRTTGALADAAAQQKDKLDAAGERIRAARAWRPADKMAAVASASADLGRVTHLSRTARQVWQRQDSSIGLNRQGSVGAAGSLEVLAWRNKDYQDIFCDPSDNGGQNDCGVPAAPPDPRYLNADTQPTKFIFDKLTIDVTDPKVEKTVEHLRYNMLGVPAAEPMAPQALASADGKEAFLDRRAWLAKYAAAASVSNLIIGWRLPGGRAGGPSVANFRKAARVPDSALTQNPSYLEIKHAIAIDEANSGRYAIENVNSQVADLENLRLDIIKSIMLRDYYELLERRALAKAIKVSTLADQVPLPEVMSSVPLRSQ